MEIVKKLTIIGDRILQYSISTPRNTISKYFVAKSRIADASDLSQSVIRCCLESGEEQICNEFRRFEALGMIKVAEYPHGIMAAPTWYNTKVAGDNIVSCVILDDFKFRDVIYYFPPTSEFFIKRGSLLIHNDSMQYDRDESNDYTGFVLLFKDGGLDGFIRTADLTPAQIETLKNVRFLVYENEKYKFIFKD